ncbi:hypothetical protein [Oharaeibacter diazotrophicus]|uniref:Uncharacterized protein n=1 Tax=Oharaeibacter diazotrophicus TaxID=1920512 RepID=A0A4R6RLA1_9HYPH|nr:hypothetical protein [Oharaeibacter diazotrophicus]TDP87429.1 hypothetical protein EDD54_1324 [Oharaeibacter diazotrophicus]BBE70627.1 hypothetical protein OHA_1_00191 [Pleomorphomonas sp. SM30]GLS77373.1 hypothetical protein GCM10007904_27100 [Oharaeibacter diazotrophicus]
MILKKFAVAAVVIAATSGAALAGDGGGQSRGKAYAAGPIPLVAADEIVVGIVNTCGTDATYTVVGRNAADGTDFATAEGTVASNRGVQVALASAEESDVQAVVALAVSCAGKRSTKPLVSLFLADGTTHLPRLALTLSEK